MLCSMFLVNNRYLLCQNGCSFDPTDFEDREEKIMVIVIDFPGFGPGAPLSTPAGGPCRSLIVKP